MARRHLDAAALAEQMGKNVAVVHRLLAGTLPIDRRLAVLLSDRVGGSASFWQLRQVQFKEALGRAAEAVPAEEARSWLKALPLRDMIGANRVSRSSGPADLEEALAFFDVVDPQEWRDRYASFSNQFSFRTSPTFASKIGALAD
jgi:plasmid maintenance system antidote protein VapI